MISNTENHIEYTINNGGEIQDSTGEDIQVPVNISTNIESNSDGSTVGETKYTAYLEDAEVVAEVPENLLTVGSNILSKGFLELMHLHKQVILVHIHMIKEIMLVYLQR